MLSFFMLSHTSAAAAASKQASKVGFVFEFRKRIKLVD